MTRQEMLHNAQEADRPAGYVVIGTKLIGDTERVIERVFATLGEAKRAGEKLWRGGLADAVRILKPRGKSHRLVKDERCTRRSRVTWTR